MPDPVRRAQETASVAAAELRARSGAAHRLRTAATAIWLVQCNPTTSDIRSAAEHGHLPPSWCVKRFLSEIRVGDRVVLWLSGASAGVYALGEVAGSIAAGTNGDAARMPVDLFVDLFDRPVARTLLKTVPSFAAESILRQPFGANPHRVSAPAFDAILDHITSRDDDHGVRSCTR